MKNEKNVNNNGKPQEVKGFLKTVEKVGNALPHPAVLFFLLAVTVVIVSHFVAAQNVEVSYFDAKHNVNVTKKAISLLTNPENKD